ncbi:MAG: hypothetical protein H5U20_12600 [Rhodobacteraceae bacterium]|nr:hypothetical protein [Paracoccaceae bacterium]
MSLGRRLVLSISPFVADEIVERLAAIAAAREAPRRRCRSVFRSRAPHRAA